MGSLLNSMSLVLEEFYNHLDVVGVSAMTGEGIEEFFEKVKGKKEEYERDYRPELERKQKERVKMQENRREKELGRLMRDMNVGGKRMKKGGAKKDDPSTLSDYEDDDEDAKMADDDDEDENDGDGEGREESGLQQR